MWKKLGKARVIALAVVMVLSVGMWAGFLSAKGRYHEDEVYTISSVVDRVWENFTIQKDEQGMPLVRTREEYAGFVSFKGLDIPLVYHNQWVDVHPPLYYILLHILIAVMPGAVMEAGFVLNIIFFLLMDLMVVAIFVLLDKEKVAVAGVLLLNLSMIGMNMVSYQRMYVVLAFFVMATAYLTLRMMRNGFTLSRKEAALLGAAVAGGFLTQYFYVIFAIVLFVMVGVWGLRSVDGGIVVMLKKNEGLRRYMIAHIGAALTGIALWPICFEHILFGYRGVGAMAGTSTGRLPEVIAWLGEGLWVFVLVFIAVAGVLIWRVRKERERLREVLVLVVPAAVYLAVVAMTAPWLDLRYFMPALAFPVMWMALLGASVCESARGEGFMSKYGEAVLAVAAVVMAGGSLVLSARGWEGGFWRGIASGGTYMFTDYHPVLEVAEGNKEEMMVYVSHFYFNAMQMVKEYKIYRESAILDFEEDMGKLGEVVGERESFILRADNWLKPEEVVERAEKAGFRVEEDFQTWPYPAWRMRRI